MRASRLFFWLAATVLLGGAAAVGCASSGTSPSDSGAKGDAATEGDAKTSGSGSGGSSSSGSSIDANDTGSCGSGTCTSGSSSEGGSSESPEAGRTSGEGGEGGAASSSGGTTGDGGYSEPRPPGPKGTVTFYLTNIDGSAQFASQPSLQLGTGTDSYPDITIDTTTTYQTIDGFGLALTNGSAQVMSGLPAATLDQALTELYDPVNGIGMSFIRISIGACDENASLYWYDTTAGDTSLNDFSLDGPDTQYTIPMLKKILAIYPNLRILGSPWSPPPWMKDNNAAVGGTLQTQYYGVYANYLVKYIQAMQAEGIGLYAITMQNEPLYGGNNPSMNFSQQQEATFLESNLGPAMKAAGLSTKVFAYDHNLDQWTYAQYVCANSSDYAAGSAFHLYGGVIGDMTTAYNATGKDVWFTEYSTYAGDTLSSGAFDWHMQNVELGAVNNWARGVIEWVTATDQNYEPHIGNCPTCLGALTVDGASYTKNVAYDFVGHMAKFIRPDAVRVASTTSNDNLMNAAFARDGVMTIVVLNTDTSSQSFNVSYGGQKFSATLESQSAATFAWDTMAQ